MKSTERNRIGVHVEDNYLDVNDPLFNEVKEVLAPTGSSQHSGNTQLGYVFSRGHYQLLSASTARILSPGSQQRFEGQLRRWSEATLGATHFTTPQLRVFPAGCGRQLLQDDVTASWHYLLSVNAGFDPRLAKVSLIPESQPAIERAPALRLDSLLRFSPQFNQLLVHATSNPYSIEIKSQSMDPSECLALLDGYMW